MLNDSAFLCVMTPTYNRAQELKKCYNSLLEQDDPSFEWLVIDDGSCDDTEKVVNDFIKENRIRIKYLKKENGGKHTAINYGVHFTDSILTMILDSDDWLKPDAVSSVKRVYEQYKNETEICGYTFLKCYPDENIMGDKFPHDGRYNFIKWRVNGVVSGEQCDIFRTDCLRECPFSEYSGEKYIGESTVWIKLALKYDMVCVNKAIYVADYVEGGLTKSGRKVRVLCPYGGMEYTNLCMMRGCSTMRRIRSSILYVAYAKYAKLKIGDIIKASNAPLYTILLYVFGEGMCYLWKRKYEGG